VTSIVVQPVRGYELPLEFLVALAELTPHQREAWIDRYVLGLPYPDESRRMLVMVARRRLRAQFGTVERLRGAAA
jgi:DNA-directed RNA polymerase specialized sigma24 family protein